MCRSASVSDICEWTFVTMLNSCMPLVVVVSVSKSFSYTVAAFAEILKITLSSRGSSHVKLFQVQLANSSHVGLLGSLYT